MERPYIILTLRRTGGTSLMTLMSLLSRYPTVQHEPFNTDRIWGKVTNDFSDATSDDLIKAQITDCLQKSVNIKHCIDVVPIRITRALIDVCLSKGYAFFFLNRRNSTRRLESLFLALSTGAWGPEEASLIYPRIKAGFIRPVPIDASKVLARATQDQASIGTTLSLLRNRGINFEWLIFEEIYGSRESAEKAAVGAASHMGVELSLRDPRLSKLVEARGQNSQEIERHVPGFSSIRETCLKNILD